MSIIRTLTLGAVNASKTLAVLEESIKNQVLTAMAVALRDKKQTILTANEQDLTQAKQNNLRRSDPGSRPKSSIGQMKFFDVRQ